MERLCANATNRLNRHPVKTARGQLAQSVGSQPREPVRFHGCCARIIGVAVATELILNAAFRVARIGPPADRSADDDYPRRLGTSVVRAFLVNLAALPTFRLARHTGATRKRRAILRNTARTQSGVQAVRVAVGYVGCQGRPACVTIMSGIAARAASVIKTRKTEPMIVSILLLTCLPMTLLSAATFNIG